MANPAYLEPLPYVSVSETDPLNPNMATDFDSLSFPPLDPDLFSNDLVLPDGLMLDLGFQDDFDFSLDDFYLPPENNDFLVGDGAEGFSSSLSTDPVGDPLSWKGFGLDGSGVSSSSQVSGDRTSDVGKILNFPSLESGSCIQEFSGKVLSQESGGCRSVVAGVLNSPSPDSGNCAGSVLTSPNSSIVPADQKIELEEIGKRCLPKRKNEREDGNSNSRSRKIRRSIRPEDTNSPCGNEEDEKKKARLMRNRESAQLSRQRKKNYVEELEDKVKSMHSTIAGMNSKISLIMAENASLRQQLGGGGTYPPPPGCYPHPSMVPMPYPWVPYAIRPQGSQVPLLPIPRLKPQQPLSASKSKKSESRKIEGKTKKVAGVSFLGLLFFMLLFGGLVPFVKDNYGGGGKTGSSGLDFYNHGINGKPQGRVLMVNGSDQCTGKSYFEGGDTKGMDFKRGRCGSDKLEINGFLGNASESLVASLYVPRNDKRVKIDGNLIIHSVLASEKAMASSRALTEGKNFKATVSWANDVGETSLAIAGNFAAALAVSKDGNNGERHHHLYRSPTERQKALESGSEDTFKENSKSTSVDGTLQKWFHEGLAVYEMANSEVRSMLLDVASSEAQGPILSSGMCTEVFQFETSPASAIPGAIIPATSVTNISAEHHPESAHLRKIKNRRILYHTPIPLNGSTTLNSTEERIEHNETFGGSKSVSSMVVSVLVDPREVGDVESDGVITPKSLSRIFVVVLLDSVKYVTYSCMLPLKASSSHLVTT
ncbi:hypothetical protein HHK36_019703 [Tetracentron sinense]|uniref:BZIP domain-containing protein n=1 Tax=Tetracentron sinense TaxID=13715 RepID=A0A834Z2N8_TETSI|nr:hypothetical protein HHK36_019703 [Tetracentron sinense]